MAVTETRPEETQDPQADLGLERGTYEVIRNRLKAAGKELRSRLAELNVARKEVFGAIETTLVGTERITTEHNCVPRDMTPVGGHFLFGYNVHIGLRSVTTPADIFSIYEFVEGSFHQKPLDLIADERFERDFREVYKYYKKAVFAKFATIDPHLFMVFRVGPGVRDVKTFKWLLDGERLQYVDNRSDHEYVFPPQHVFEWVRTHRDMHASGAFPHISIEDRVFVETTGGDLTVKIENNTDSGEGIYAESVDNPDQTLDDADVFYALVGNLVLLKIRPYQEPKYRYLVYCEKTQQVRRLDSVEHACVLLPDDHGIIFSNGYFLQTGECKLFESGQVDMIYQGRVASPNGEDYLFVFYNRLSGVYVLLPYNLIEQHVDTPITCNGFSLFDSGELVYFKVQGEPQKHHALQIWQTPYTGPDYERPTQTKSHLYKIGNRDIVRGMAECHEILGLIAQEDTYANLFIDLAKEAGDVLDSYYWIGHEEAFNPAEILRQIKEAADAAIGEFEKVQAVRRATAEELKRVTSRTREIVSAIRARRFETIDDFVASLVDLRALRGEIIACRELRYVDVARVDALEAEIDENSQRVANDCVGFLLKAKSLAPYERSVAEHRDKIDDLKTVADAKQLEARVDQSAGELEMLIEVVSNLKIDDATQRTTIIDNISAIFSQLNQTRAGLKTKMQDLARVEGVAEFNSQLKLLNQGVVNYLDVCDTPGRCDEYLTKMMVQVEELEGKFAEFDEFVGQLVEKREEIYAAFEARKQQLVEARNKRATALAQAADRILRGIKTRVDALQQINEIHGYFASDLMIEKVRDIIRQLGDLGDTVKVDDVQSRLKTIREDAVRQLKDRQDLYEDGADVIRLGNHRFTVNRQPFELTTVQRDGQMQLHLTGTNFFEEIEDEQLLATRDVWTQEVLSEDVEVYRGEYLAFCMFAALGTENLPGVDELRDYNEEQRLECVRRFMGPRYSEGYVKGVHDHDAARILAALAEMDATIGLLRYHPQARAMARVFWHQYVDPSRRTIITAALKGFGTIRELFPETRRQQQYIVEARRLIGEYVASNRLFDENLVAQAGEYLFEELVRGGQFCISRRAAQLCQEFRGYLDQKFFAEQYAKSVEDVRSDAEAAFLLNRDWVTAFLDTRTGHDDADYADEVAALLLTESFDPARVVEASVRQVLEGMVGNHPLIQDSKYPLDFNTFMLKLDRYRREVVPRFEAYGRLKKELVERERERLRLDEFRPRVLTSFVRNRLIDEVYLRLLGDNLAKQAGVAGEAKRTDRMGLLLLVSPPGYGKTTLMEYIANRLGVVFMKINGPALGHEVTSLDPGAAPNAAAREELGKLSLAFEMGDNVMIYVDDIQHCHPEFLQKFISLCDAQRKIEGVYRGRTRTYDLRGKKAVVVMAGNPYTESGEKFRIPDMLANRADTYNLGEIIGASRDAFVMSYLENALTSNPVLNKLAARSQKDVYGVIRMAETDSAEGVDLEGNYSLIELNEMIAVMRKLMRVRDVVLRVNEQYIRSASTADEYRTEPAFKLQGSYRNMNRIAERVVAVMNDEELEELIFSSYQNDAQTLTTGTESNLLKFKQLVGRLTPEEAQRWEDIQRIYRRNVRLRGVGEDDKVGLVVTELSGLSDSLDSIRQALGSGLDQLLTHEQPEPVAEPSPLAASFSPETIVAMKGLVDEIKTALQKRLEPETADLPPQEIHVVSRIPGTILNVLRHQFKLMQGWLHPLLEQSRGQSQEIAKLRELIAENLTGYQTLISQLEEAAAQDDALLEKLAKHKIKVTQAHRPHPERDAK